MPSHGDKTSLQHLCVVAESSLAFLAANAAGLVAAKWHSSVESIPHVHLCVRS